MARVSSAGGVQDNLTYLRPNTFASNAFWWRDSIRAGKVVDPTGDGRQAVIDPEDIAHVAVAALTEDGHVGKGTSSPVRRP